ncbi:PilW family protein [Aeromonas hydrophila]|jgi:MSHA biogenesis protein MshO|uniref:PilW family protein n=1 Tax=Aeromonas hydrophila TaxID=644 RepID=UPI0009B814D2|nr:type II secretion system protein [Aeromonas hydrophila]MDX7757467.1 type II secretion system protein [Aeromonas hydrophila]
MDKSHSRYAASDDAAVTTTRYRVQLGFANRTCAQPGRGWGFTLVELVMVILLLGVMATFSSQFIGIGTQIYGDASRREQLMSDARFALERLNRELRDAVPGSVRIEDETGNPLDQGVCLRFWPIATASRYLGSAASAGLTIVVPDVLPREEDEAIVYPLADPALNLEQGCLHGKCVARIISVGSPVSGALPLTVDGSFARESPGQRIYFSRQQVRYCVTNAVLTRASAAIGADISLGTSALMAEHIRPAPYYFYLEPAAFSQSEVGLRLELEQRGERVLFNHKLETLNVP